MLKIASGQRSAIGATMARVAEDLGQFSPLSPDDRDRMQIAGRRFETFNNGAQIRARIDGSPRAGVILSGWACEQCILLDGRRQIFSILVSGDPIVMLGDSAPMMRSVVALTRLEFADLTPIVRYGSPSIGEGAPKAFADAISQQRNRLFDHIVRLGRHTARERIVHLLLELRDRLELAGLVKAQTFRIPLTQETLADTLGLSVVHIHRTLQQLRREGLIELKSGGVTLLKPAQLAAIVEVAEPPTQRVELRSKRPFPMASYSSAIT